MSSLNSSDEKMGSSNIKESLYILPKEIWRKFLHNLSYIKAKDQKGTQKVDFLTSPMSFPGFVYEFPRPIFDHRKVRKVSLLEEQIWIIPFAHSTGQNWPLQIHDQILNFFPRLK